MKKKIKKIAIIFLAFSFFLSVSVFPTNAGIPVIDGTNLSQNIMNLLESIAQTAKQVEQYTQQIQQYETQLQQYENMLKNTLAAPNWFWDDASSTITSLVNTVDTLAYYKTALGSIDAYLSKFKDTADYRNSPCFSTGCTDQEWAKLKDSQTLGSESQKKATDALFKGLDVQQNQIVAEAQKLKEMQSNAQSADGQAQALGYANQFASYQANQLLNIRGLLMAEQNVVATRNQALADQEALQAAATQKAIEGASNVQSSGKSY